MISNFQKEILNYNVRTCQFVKFQKVQENRLKKDGVYIIKLEQKSEKKQETINKYKNLFKKLKKQSKKFYFQNILKQYENNIKNTLNVIKSVIEWYEIKNDNFQKSLDINK